MRIKLVVFPIVLLASMLILSVIACAYPFKPDKGFVPDESTAIKIAEAVFIPIYGEQDVIYHRPYKAVLKDKSIWLVTGTLESNAVGGVPEIQLQKSDGKILHVFHAK